MKLLLLLSLLVTQTFAALNQESQCPKGEDLERFTPESLKDIGIKTDQDIFLCVKSIQQCHQVTNLSKFKSDLSSTLFRIEEGFQCSGSNGQQCQQQQQQTSHQYQQNLKPEAQIKKITNLALEKSIRNITSVSSGDYVKFNKKMYRCL